MKGKESIYKGSTIHDIFDGLAEIWTDILKSIAGTLFLILNTFADRNSFKRITDYL